LQQFNHSDQQLAMDNPTRILGFLKQGRWFDQLPASLQDLIVQRSWVRSFRKGGVLISEGAQPKGIYAVLHGRVRAVRRVGDADEILIYVGEAGFWVGEFAVLARVPSIGSVIADTAVRALFLPAREFERIVEDEPRYYRAFADLSFERHALLFRYLVEAGGLAPDEWLRTRLVDLAAMRRNESPTSDPFTITMSQSDLAKMVGASRQTLSRLLDRLQTRGLIKIGYRSIRVLG
jgi:CRP-like cAMP-binding protein